MIKLNREKHWLDGANSISDGVTLQKLFDHSHSVFQPNLLLGHSLDVKLFSVLVVNQVHFFSKFHANRRIYLGQYCFFMAFSVAIPKSLRRLGCQKTHKGEN